MKISIHFFRSLNTATVFVQDGRLSYHRIKHFANFEEFKAYLLTIIPLADVTLYSL